MWQIVEPMAVEDFINTKNTEHLLGALNGTRAGNSVFLSEIISVQPYSVCWQMFLDQFLEFALWNLMDTATFVSNHDPKLENPQIVETQVSATLDATVHDGIIFLSQVGFPSYFAGLYTSLTAEILQQIQQYYKPTYHFNFIMGSPHCTKLKSLGQNVAGTPSPQVQVARFSQGTLVHGGHEGCMLHSDIM